MRWSIFLLFTFIALVLQDGLEGLFQINGVSPSFLLILAVYINLRAPMPTLAWSSLVLGIVVDLTTRTWSSGDAGVHYALIGPMALGYLLGGFGAVQIRGMVFRDSPMTLGMLVFVLGIAVHLLGVLLISLRGVPWFLNEPMLDYSASNEIVLRFFELIYTAVLAVPLGYVLRGTTGLWGFEKTKGMNRY